MKTFIPTIALSAEILVYDKDGNEKMFHVNAPTFEMFYEKLASLKRKLDKEQTI